MQVALDDYVWAAGIATELINTTAEVWRGDDRLPDLGALIAFVDLHARDGHEGPGELSALARRARPADLQAVRSLRATVRDLVDHPDQGHLIAGAAALTSSAGGATLVPDPAYDHRTRWAVSLRPEATIYDALSLICGVGILGVVHTLGEGRFRPCGAPTCRGAFIDTTRPGRRRYCMPGLCGNRINVANHRARQAAAREPDTTE
ncbi:CGNR zinc finger domain-containing protein [Actinomadura sp. 9N407]|uniref:CGNR zinc finger domain-containing protein n=1 Tax=Actinomadura sp. 9N407 TaxID=3375154 RepID=UPI0037B6EB79